jgi:hypothetical protein
VSKSTFLSDLNARIQEAERIIADQNENLTALHHLLRNEMSENVPVAATPTNGKTPEANSSQLKGKPSEIVLTLVQQSGEHGTRPRDIAAILVEHKLMNEGLERCSFSPE